MTTKVMSNEVQAIETLMEISASVLEKLNSLIRIEAPVKPLAFSSDCCSSNNYPQEQQ